MYFQATAYNKNNDRFRFRFYNSNWADITNVAKKALDNVVANDKLHQKYGPWNFKNIDVCA